MPSVSPTRQVEQARQLRELHVPGRPLILPNAWDAASARAVERAGFPVVATSSLAVAESLGFEDGQKMAAATAFEALGRIASSVSVPVTADIEAGYGLSAEELVQKLLGARAVGCNIEDTDHARGGLLDAAEQAGNIAGLRRAAEGSGVQLVINARIDVYLRESGEPPDRDAEALRRGRLYLDAGADCVYPIMLIDEEAIAAFVESCGGMVNVYARPEAPPLARLAELGVARVSFGPWLYRLALRDVASLLGEIAAGRDPYETPRPL